MAIKNCCLKINFKFMNKLPKATKETMEISLFKKKWVLLDSTLSRSFLEQHFNIYYDK